MVDIVLGLIIFLFLCSVFGAVAIGAVCCAVYAAKKLLHEIRHFWEEDE